MPINKKEITKDMIRKAMQCKDADELMALAGGKCYMDCPDFECTY